MPDSANDALSREPFVVTLTNGRQLTVSGPPICGVSTREMERFFFLDGSGHCTSVIAPGLWKSVNIDV